MIQDDAFKYNRKIFDYIFNESESDDSNFPPQNILHNVLSFPDPLPFTILSVRNYSWGINESRMVSFTETLWNASRYTIEKWVLKLAGLRPVGNEFPAVDSRLCHGES